MLYLDFNGHTTSGTHWNTGYTGGQDIVSPAYDTDGNASQFSNTELENIQAIWQHVTEDFAAFDVDVTTEEPDIEALRKTSPQDDAYGQRVVIGGSSTWLGGSYGGVAQIGSFDDDIDLPCFVFPAGLNNGEPKATAEASSHEAGHTLGLFHDGTGAHNGLPAFTYYNGHGNWAPIMGVGYYKPVTHWSKGDYPWANNQEDDLAIMQTYGVPLRTDAHWNFGDGQTSTAQHPGVHTYQNAGAYHVTLTVTDNDGTIGTDTNPVVIFPSNTAIYVDSINMSLNNLTGGFKSANAAVKIVRFDGTPMRNANVTVTWSGLVTGTKTAKTNTQGIATITSNKSNASGTFTATVTNVVLTGNPYFAPGNNETSDSISKP